jgi:hypothetical protein
MVSIISISNDESSQKLHKRLTLWKTYPTYPQDFNLKNMFFGGPKGYAAKGLILRLVFGISLDTRRK